jgi:hypothetical protein
LDSKIRSNISKLTKLLAQFGSVELEGIEAPEKVKIYETKMAELREKIAMEQKAINKLK